MGDSSHLFEKNRAWVARVINVIDQGPHVCETTIVQDAWERGQPLAVHAWIYGLHDGHWQGLGFCAAAADEAAAALEQAVAMRRREWAHAP